MINIGSLTFAPRIRFIKFLALSLTCASGLWAQDDAEEVFELSPFSIDADDTDGYQAISTLAGTRIKTDLRDIGAAISVITPEFLEDTGAVDAATVLSYSLNTEVSGEQGNFAGGVETGDDRSNPAVNGQRVRGISPASLTRGYFLTDIPFDSYNTSRITINRGPNSLLFGVGNPGGVINNQVKLATIGDDFGHLRLRLGERGGHREELDINRVLIKDRLALRLVGVNEEIQFKQRPAYETDQRIHASLEGVLSQNRDSNLLGRLTFRANYEKGMIEGTPVNVVPPADSLSNWFEHQIDNREVVERMSGISLPGHIDNSFEDSYGLFVPHTTVNTLMGVPSGRQSGLNARLSAWVNIPITWNHIGQHHPSTGLPDSPEVAGVLARVIWNKAPEYNRGRFETPMTISDFWGSGVPGFISHRVPASILDNESLLWSGNTNYVGHEFEAQNFSLEQGFLNGKGGIELVYDEQMYERNASLPFDQDWKIDISSHLTNDQPNPNVGKLLGWGSHEPAYFSTFRSAKRATIFYEHDFAENDGWLSHLGNHVFTGLYNEQTIDRLDRNYKMIWNHDTSYKTAADIFTGNQTHGRRTLQHYHYLTDNLVGTNLSDLKVTSYITPKMPVHGDRYYLSWNDHPTPSANPNGVNVPADPTQYIPGTGDPSYYDTFIANKQLLSAFRNKQIINSEALSWQSKFLNGNIVGLLGWRDDESINTGQASVDKDGDGNPLPGQQELSDASEVVEGSTMTKSVVAHLPLNIGGTRWSAHWNTSENFSPAATRRNIRGNVIPSPLGETKEVGIGAEFFDGRMSLRISKYKMTTDYQDAYLGGAINGILAPLGAVRWGLLQSDGTTWQEVYDVMYDDRNRFPDAKRFNSYDELFTALGNYLPSDIESLINRRYDADGAYLYDRILGASATRGYTSEGTEIELVGNATKNWRMVLNVGQQETVTADTAPVLAEVANLVAAGYEREGLWGHQDAPDNDADSTFGGRFNGATLIPIAKAKSADGTVSLEQREWRINFATNYDFTDGILNGFGIGGSYRYQSAVATGYENAVNADGLVLPMLDRPHWGPDSWNGDLWISYKRRLTDDIDWKIQLNVRNLFGDDDLIPVVTNPDGRVAAYRNSNPRDTFLTSTFSF